jgi:hypothetical protein
MSATAEALGMGLKRQRGTGDQTSPDYRPIEAPLPLPSEVQPGVLRAPPHPAAQWLSAVERRLQDSVGVAEFESLRDGRSLSINIVTRGKVFFQMTSDLLPGEPYVYSSLRGDLVADFRKQGATLTYIVAPESLTALLAMDGNITRELIDLESSNQGEVRKQVQILTKRFRSGENGSVGS